MNLYDLHPDPENAPGYATRYDNVPELVWERYGLWPEELKKREKVLARDAEIAYAYARWVLKGPFPAGEAVIAKDAGLALDYVMDVLRGPFPAGEAAIATDAQHAYWYAHEVLEKPFPAGEAAIATDAHLAYQYARKVLKLTVPKAKVWPKKLTEQLVLEATVGEQKSRAVVMIGRLSVPTVGHYKVIDLMKAFIRNNPDLHLSPSPVVVIVDGEKTGEDKHRNPLTAEERVKFMTASGRANGVVFLTAASGFAAFEEVRKQGWEPIAVAAGSDRADAYLKLLNKYFTKKDGSPIKHVLVPGLERGPEGTKGTAMERALEDLKRDGALDVAEVSGSMARRAVELGYEEEFAQIVGLEKKPKLAKLMFEKVKRSLDGAEPV